MVVEIDRFQPLKESQYMSWLICEGCGRAENLCHCNKGGRMTTEVIKKDESILEKVILQGDLAELSPRDRVIYYGKVCDSLGLNPYTRPFDYIKLNNKLTLYARRDATDQLRSIKSVSIEIPSRETIDGVYVVTARAKMGNRVDESTGAVDISKLTGEFKANAMMKAETKAKRRVTLSIVGLGWLDETEIADIDKKDAVEVKVDAETGNINPQPQNKPTKPVEVGNPPVPKASAATLADLTEAMEAGVKTGDEVLAKVKANGWAAKKRGELTEDQAKQLIAWCKE